MIEKGVSRVQGLMVQKGNPLGIKDFRDIRNVRYVNRQRGIGEDEARMMLMSAFAHEVVRTIRIPILADRYAEMIENRLRGKQAACGDCFMKCDKRG